MKRLEAGSGSERAADPMKLPHKVFGPFTRVNPPLDDPVVVGTAFGLEVGQRSPVLDTKQRMYVLKVLEHTKADSAQFEKELDTFRATDDRPARQDRVRSYLTALRDAAKVVDNRKKVFRPSKAQPRDVVTAAGDRTNRRGHDRVMPPCCFPSAIDPPTARDAWGLPISESTVAGHPSAVAARSAAGRLGP